MLKRREKGLIFLIKTFLIVLLQIPGCENKRIKSSECNQCCQCNASVFVLQEQLSQGEPLCFIFREDLEEFGGEYQISNNISSTVSGLCTQWKVLCLLYSQRTVHPGYWMFFSFIGHFGDWFEKKNFISLILFKTFKWFKIKKTFFLHFHTETEIVY